MPQPPLDLLHTFIIRAKAATYVGGGAQAPSCRTGSHDLCFEEDAFAYLDSYFGGSDFLGEEVICYQGAPAWAMNYYGRILEPTLITATQAGQVIQASLSAMYKLGRFLGGFEHEMGTFKYFDTNTGALTSFTGKEWITRDGVVVYDLVYHGGLIKD